MEQILEVIQREFIYVWYYFTVQLRQIALYYALGIVIGSVISVFVKDKIHGLFRSMGDKKLGVLGVIPASILRIASPLCMYGTIPLIREWLYSGMSMGSASAFMLTGPSTNITNLGALKIVLGVKRFLLYLAFVMLFSFATGIVVNLIL